MYVATEWLLGRELRYAIITLPVVYKPSQRSRIRGQLRYSYAGFEQQFRNISITTRTCNYRVQPLETA